jgi:glycosyltransferase involved in cell wall biosynthesis
VGLKLLKEEKVFSNEYVIDVDTSPGQTTGQSAMLALAIDALGDRVVRVRGNGSANSHFSRIRSALSVFLQIRQHARNQNYEVLYHAHSRSTFGLIRDWLLCLHFRKKLRIVFHCHEFDLVDGHPSKIEKALVKSIFGRLDSWVFLNRASIPGYLKVLEANSTTQIRAKLRIVDNALPAESLRYLSTPERQRYSRNTEVKSLFLSNFIPGKGFDQFQRVADAYNGKIVSGCRINFDAIGNFLDRRSGNDFSARFPANLSVWENLSRKEVLDHLRDADILIFPSRYASECQPLVIIESMAAHTKVIAFNHKSMPEQFREFDIHWTSETNLLESVSEEVSLMMTPDWGEKRALDSFRVFQRFSEARFEQNLLEAMGSA